MTKDEAREIIDKCAGWNSGQRSISMAMHGERTMEDDLLDAKRAALIEAWKTLGEELLP